MLKYIPPFILIMHGVLILNGYKFERFSNDKSSAILSIVIGIIMLIFVLFKNIANKHNEYKDNFKIKQKSNSITLDSNKTTDNVHKNDKKINNKYKIMFCKIYNVLFLILLLLFGFNLLPYPNLMFFFTFIMILCQFDSEETQKYFEKLNNRLYEKEKQKKD